MSTDLIPFTYEDFQVRTVLIDGEPWFVAADACAVLALRDTSSALKMVDPEDLQRLCRSDTPQFFGGIAPQVQEITVVNESGLYALIFHSRKPEAKKFKRWVTHEVIPQIRKTGRYEVAPATIELSVDEYERMLDGGKQMVTKLRWSPSSARHGGNWSRRPPGTPNWNRPHPRGRPWQAAPATTACGADSKGGDPEYWPADLRVREFPTAVTP